MLSSHHSPSSYLEQYRRALAEAGKISAFRQVSSHDSRILSILIPKLVRSFVTANLPDESIIPMSSVCKPGVYFGYAQVYGLSGQEGKVHPMVMSLGWNPFYKNERLTAVCILLLLLTTPPSSLTRTPLDVRRKFTSCTISSLTSTVMTCKQLS
jgi:Riboflavin kinase